MSVSDFMSAMSAVHWQYIGSVERNTWILHLISCIRPKILMLVPMLVATHDYDKTQIQFSYYHSH